MSLFKQHSAVDASSMMYKPYCFRLVFVSTRDFITSEVYVGNLKNPVYIDYCLRPRDCKAGRLFSEYRYRIR